MATDRHVRTKPEIFVVPNRDWANYESGRFIKSAKPRDTVENLRAALDFIKTKKASVILCDPDLYEFLTGKDTGVFKLNYAAYK